MTIALPFPEKIHISSDVQINDRVLVVDLGDGYQQRMNLGINAQYEGWNILYPALTHAELQTINAVLNSVGAVTSMTWTSPIDGVLKKYAVVKDSRKIQSLGSLWRLSLSLKQVFEP